MESRSFEEWVDAQKCHLTMEQVHLLLLANKLNPIEALLCLHSMLASVLRDFPNVEEKVERLNKVVYEILDSCRVDKTIRDGQHKGHM